MVNFSILISNSGEVTGPGGLFDINLTLPLVVIQFIILTLILNFLLYKPLLTIINERNEFIINNLSLASETLTKANRLTLQYEEDLNNVRKKAQTEIINSQKLHKEILDNELELSQTYIDALLNKITNAFDEKKQNIFSNLTNQVNALTTQIENKLSI